MRLRCDNQVKKRIPIGRGNFELRRIFNTKLGKLCHGTGMIRFNRLAFRVRAANEKPHWVFLMAFSKGYLMGEMRTALAWVTFNSHIANWPSAATKTSGMP